MTKTFIASLMLFAAACGGGPVPATVADTAPETTIVAPEVLLEVRDEGGFVPIEWAIGRMPRYVLMRDGTLYGPGMMTMEYPGRLLPSVMVGTIGEQAMGDILQYIEDIDFASITSERNDEANRQVADAPDTVVTYFDEEGEHQFSVYALGFVETGDARVALLNSMVMSLDQAMVEAIPAGEFTPKRIEVLAGVSELGGDPQFVNERPWPLDVTFSEMVETPAGWRCIALDGDTAVAALDIFADANAASTWNDGSAVYSIVVRYLYPYQAGCGTEG